MKVEFPNEEKGIQLSNDGQLDADLETQLVLNFHIMFLNLTNISAQMSKCYVMASIHKHKNRKSNKKGSKAYLIFFTCPQMYMCTKLLRSSTYARIVASSFHFFYIFHLFIYNNNQAYHSANVFIAETHLCVALGSFRIPKSSKYIKK